MQDIKVVLTMDCEPTTATSHPAATGPANWSAGEEAVRGFADIAARYGLPVTFFVHPEAAVAQAVMFRDLERNGACLGLHMHPWKYSLWRHNGIKFFAHYGGLSSAEQQELLAEASVIWADAIGHHPSISVQGPFRQMIRSLPCSNHKGSAEALARHQVASFPKCRRSGSAANLIRIEDIQRFARLGVISISRTCLCRRISHG